MERDNRVHIKYMSRYTIPQKAVLIKMSTDSS